LLLLQRWNPASLYENSAVRFAANKDPERICLKEPSKPERASMLTPPQPRRIERLEKPTTGHITFEPCFAILLPLKLGNEV